MACVAGAATRRSRQEGARDRVSRSAERLGALGGPARLRLAQVLLCSGVPMRRPELALKLEIATGSLDKAVRRLERAGVVEVLHGRRGDGADAQWIVMPDAVRGWVAEVLRAADQR